MAHLLRAPDARASEDLRNCVLRRADWRFLLSAPRPEVSVVYGDGPLGEAVRAISARCVDGRRAQPSGECDLAVAIDPDKATLRSAWSALRAGGSCYVEWTSRTGPGAGVIRRRLARAGFVDVSCYTPRPAPAHGPPQVWLPLGAPAAVRWYLRSGPRVRGVRHALTCAARRLRWRVSAWLPVATPICTIGRRPLTRADLDRRDTCAGGDFQAELWHAIEGRRRTGDPGRTPERPPWVLITRGARSINKVVLLAPAADGKAALVVKVPRTPMAAAGLEREAAVLEQVHSMHRGLAGIPRVLFSGSYGGVQAVGETALDGVPLSHLVRRLDYRTLAMKAVEWQAKLVDRSGPQPPASWRGRLIDPILNDLARPLGGIVDPALIAATRSLLSTLGPLPLACEQRDFSPWNVWLTPTGDLAVLDWESAEPRGLPALDLIYFLTYLAVSRERAWAADRLREVHRSTLDPGTALGAVTGACLRRYAELTGIDPAALGPLRMLCWLVHARSECQRLAAETRGRPNSSALGQSVFVALWEQELRALWSAAA